VISHNIYLVHAKKINIFTLSDNTNINLFKLLFVEQKETRRYSRTLAIYGVEPEKELVLNEELFGNCGRIG
jgi:hypothetical protein